jgi:kynureninase
MSFEATLECARSLDAADVLASFRERFELPQDAHGKPLIYLCGHSLGLMPRAARALVTQELDDWGALGVLGHESARRPWIPYHENLAAGLAELTGAAPQEVVAMNSLTANLHLMLAAFFRPRGKRRKILIEAGAFPSDRHAVASQLEWHGLDARSALIELAPAAMEDVVSEEEIEGTLQQLGSEIALVLWPGVQYRTGQAFDLARIARAAHRKRCLVGFDLAHSIGNTELQLARCGADFAVWCSYKYLNAGPGAIGGCFIHERHLGTTPRSHLAGWWGHEATTRFLMRPEFHAASGAPGWQISNPPILSAAPLVASLEIFIEARLARLRAKSIALTGFCEFLLERLAPAVRIITPREPGERGCQLSLRVAGGRRVLERLGAAGVICDWREPDTLRVAPVPLYNRFEDVWRFSEQLTQVLGSTD